MSDAEHVFCSFCGTIDTDCEQIHRGPSAAICSRCVVLALDIMLHGFPEVDRAAEDERIRQRDERMKKPWLEARPEIDPAECKHADWTIAHGRRCLSCGTLMYDPGD